MDDKQLQEVGVKAANSFYVAPSATPYSIFLAGWNTAIHQIRLLAQTPGGDGCFCAHHPDDPAHMKDCYDLTKALTGG